MMAIFLSRSCLLQFLSCSPVEGPLSRDPCYGAAIYLSPEGGTAATQVDTPRGRGRASLHGRQNSKYLNYNNNKALNEKSLLLS